MDGYLVCLFYQHSQQLFPIIQCFCLHQHQIFGFSLHLFKKKVHRESWMFMPATFDCIRVSIHTLEEVEGVKTDNSSVICQCRVFLDVWVQPCMLSWFDFSQLRRVTRSGFTLPPLKMSSSDTLRVFWEKWIIALYPTGYIHECIIAKECNLRADKTDLALSEGIYQQWWKKYSRFFP